MKMKSMGMMVGGIGALERSSRKAKTRPKVRFAQLMSLIGKKKPKSTMPKIRGTKMVGGMRGMPM